jgi:uncharacterized protein YecE (DUF72 family)
LGKRAVPARHKRPGTLDYYTARYQTVEVNSSYYHWPHDATFTSWHERLPDDFRMVVKRRAG